MGPLLLGPLHVYFLLRFPVVSNLGHLPVQSVPMATITTGLTFLEGLFVQLLLSAPVLSVQNLL